MNPTQDATENIAAHAQTAGAVRGLLNQFTLPWPPSALFKSAHATRQEKSAVAEKYKQACFALTKQAEFKLSDSPKLAIWLDFYPPDRRYREDENITAAFRPGCDGLMLALGIDFKRIRQLSYVQHEIGGYVKVRITEVPEFGG